LTGVEYAHRTWNPVVGCSPVTVECVSCFAATAHERVYWRPGDPKFHQVRVMHERFDEPLRWRKPSRVLVSTMGDVFHESVPQADLDQIVARLIVPQIRREFPQHRFLVTTKRAERMARTLSFTSREEDPNLWLGVSAGCGATYHELSAPLLRMHCRKWLSMEPLIEPFEFDPSPYDWVVVGGESGAQDRARACAMAWVEEVIERCREAGVPVYVKQMGTWWAHNVNPIWKTNEPAGRRGENIEAWPEPLRVREFPVDMLIPERWEVAG